MANRRRIMLAWWRRYRISKAGNIAIMAALAAPVALVAAGFAIDEAALYTDRRELQNVDDIAAMVAAQNLAQATRAAQMSLADNGMASAAISGGSQSGGIVAGSKLSPDQIALTVVKGNYTADKAVSPAQRFKAGAAPYNAVRVGLRKLGRLYFLAAFRAPPELSATATASVSAEAAFSIGSRLASLNGGIVNGLLGGLLGTNISLSVMDYNALLDAHVQVLGFMNALASQLNVTAGTYDDVLNAGATVADVAKALVAANAGSLAASSELRAFASAVSDVKLAVPLKQLFDLGPLGHLAIGQSDPDFSADASVLDILTATAMIADGTHQATLDLGATLPGVASTTLTVAIGEPPQKSPWYTVGDTGAVVRTAQTRLALVASIGGTGILSAIQIKLPIYLQLAYSEASLKSISCSSGKVTSAQVNVDATPGIVDAWIGNVDPAKLRYFDSTTSVGSATLINAPLIQVTGTSHVQIGDTSPTTLSFSYGDITSHTYHEASTSSFVSSLTASLIGQLDVTVKLAGLSLLSTSAVASAVASQLGAVTPVVDGALSNILNLAGVKLGSADVWVNGVKCQHAVLSQ